MMRRSAELSLARVLAIYAAGAVAGIQIALYMFDLYDDGIADVRSLFIGLLFFVFGLIFVLRSFRARRNSLNRRDASS